MGIQIRLVLGKLPVVNGGIGKLAIQRRSVCDAATHEFRPGRDCDLRFDGLRQESPELRVKPAQIVSRAVAVRSDAGAEPLNLLNQRSAVHAIKIVIHSVILPVCRREARI